MELNKLVQCLKIMIFNTVGSIFRLRDKTIEVYQSSAILLFKILLQKLELVSLMFYLTQSKDLIVYFALFSYILP